MSKKVLFIVQNLPLPQDRRVFSEARALKKNGWEVFAISPGHNQLSQEKIEGIRVFRYSEPPKAKNIVAHLWEYLYTFINTFWLAIKIYSQEKFSVIHIANPPDFFFLIGVFFKLFGVKFIFDQHDLMPEMAIAKFKVGENHGIYRILLLFEKLALKSADIHITTCSEGLAVVRKRHYFKAPSFIVQNGINYNLVYSDTPKKESLSSIAKFPFLGVYVGVMGPQDGGEKLLHSIEYVVKEKKRKDIGFILMGDGDDRERLEVLAKKLEISNNVIFTGWADSKMISTYLNVADVGLMPEPKNSYTDNSLHNKVLEYMAAGLPLVAYDLNTANRVAGKAGEFIENDDETKFGEAIVTLINNPLRRKEMGEVGKKRVEEDFDWELSEGVLTGVYKRYFV